VRRVGSLKVEWPDKVRAALPAARSAYSHTQGQCAMELSKLADIPIDQSMVSRWESGAIKRPSPDARRAIAAYIDGVAATHAPDAHAPDTAADASTGEGSDRVAFGALLASAAGEPLLAPTQVELARALVRRLGNGPPMNGHDAEIAHTLGRALGLFAH